MDILCCSKATARIAYRYLRCVTDALSTVLRLLREESVEASWLIQARSRMELVEPYNKEW